MHTRDRRVLTEALCCDSAFRMNSVRRCCCKPTSSCNKSRAPVGLWRSLASVGSSAQRYSTCQPSTSVVYLVLCNADELISQIVDDQRCDGAGVTFQAADELVADGVGIPQANKRVESAGDDHRELVGVVERLDAAVDAVVGVVLAGLQRDDVADEQRPAVLAVLTARDPRTQRRHELDLFNTRRTSDNMEK